VLGLPSDQNPSLPYSAAHGGHPHGWDGGGPWPVVLCLLKSPEEYIGQVLGLSTGKLTEPEYATVLSQQTGKTV